LERGIKVDPWLAGMTPSKSQQIFEELSVFTPVRDAVLATITPIVISGREHIPAPPRLIKLEGFSDFVSGLDDDFVAQRKFADKVEERRKLNHEKPTPAPKDLPAEGEPPDELDILNRFKRPINPDGYSVEDKFIDILCCVNYTTWIPELSMLDLDDYAFLAQTPYFMYGSLHTVKTPSSEGTEPLSFFEYRVNDSFPFSENMHVLPALFLRFKAMCESASITSGGGTTAFDAKCQAPMPRTCSWEFWSDRSFLRKNRLDKAAPIASQFAMEVKATLHEGPHLSFIDLDLCKNIRHQFEREPHRTIIPWIISGGLYRSWCITLDDPTLFTGVHTITDLRSNADFQSAPAMFLSHSL